MACLWCIGQVVYYFTACIYILPRCASAEKRNGKKEEEEEEEVGKDEEDEEDGEDEEEQSEFKLVFIAHVCCMLCCSLWEWQWFLYVLIH